MLRAQDSPDSISLLNKNSSEVHEVMQLEQLYEQIRLSHTHLPCDVCGRSDYIFVSTYRRKVITIANGKRAVFYVWIPCVRCEGCGGYCHAVLFDLLIPYSSYTLLFIMTVLGDYLNRKGTVQDICEKWEISLPTLYAWKRRFMVHYDHWCDSLRKIRFANAQASYSASSSTDRSTFYSQLCLRMKNALNHVFSFSGFAANFFAKIRKFSFLQPNQKTHSRTVPRPCR